MAAPEDQQLLRYSRHLLLDQIGEVGQHRLGLAKMLVVGVGGLGSPAAMFLAAAGVGTLYLADDDKVDLTNLQRQILHDMQSIGTAKVISGKARLAKLNPECRVIALEERLGGARMMDVVADMDVVLDCSDNFTTRHEINHACVAHSVPLVSGAAIRFDGQLAVFNRSGVNNSCYNCLYPDQTPQEEMRCALMGVFAPVTGIIGTMQAAEALKISASLGKPSHDRLLLFNALTTEWHTVRIAKNPDCTVCGR